MATIYDVDSNALIERAAEKLKSVDSVKPPKWAGFVKTGVHKERRPIRTDWWYVRAAAVLRTVYRLGPVGVSKLRKKYGGRKRRGFKPAHQYPASGNILRKVLQQLEKAKLIKSELKSLHKGRLITPEGKSFLDKIAVEISKEKKRQIKEMKKEEQAPIPQEIKQIKKEEVKQIPKEHVKELPAGAKEIKAPEKNG
jgi:small subunit ribosomal protein S19e